MITDHPASVSTSAAGRARRAGPDDDARPRRPPAQPSADGAGARGSGTAGDLRVGVPAGLDVTRVADRDPARAGPGCRRTRRLRTRPRRRDGRGGSGRRGRRRRRASCSARRRASRSRHRARRARSRYSACQPRYGPLNSRSGRTLGALDPGPPGQLLEATQRDELVEAGVTPSPARERATGVDARGGSNVNAPRRVSM